MVKHLPTMCETQVRSLGGEDPLEKEMATHSMLAHTNMDIFLYRRFKRFSKVFFSTRVPNRVTTFNICEDSLFFTLV